MRTVNTNAICYDEANSFYLMIHIMEDLDYRLMFDKKLSKTIQTLELIGYNIQKHFPKVYNHFVSVDSNFMTQFFIQVVMTIFISSL